MSDSKFWSLLSGLVLILTALGICYRHKVGKFFREKVCKCHKVENSNNGSDEERLLGDNGGDGGDGGGGGSGNAGVVNNENYQPGEDDKDLKLYFDFLKKGDKPKHPPKQQKTATTSFNSRDDATIKTENLPQQQQQQRGRSAQRKIAPRRVAPRRCYAPPARTMLRLPRPNIQNSPGTPATPAQYRVVRRRVTEEVAVHRRPPMVIHFHTEITV